MKDYKIYEIRGDSHKLILVINDNIVYRLRGKEFVLSSLVFRYFKADIVAEETIWYTSVGRELLKLQYPNIEDL